MRIVRIRIVGEGEHSEKPVTCSRCRYRWYGKSNTKINGRQRQGGKGRRREGGKEERREGEKERRREGKKE